MIKHRHHQLKPTSELILVRMLYTLNMTFFTVGSGLLLKNLGMSNALIGLTTSLGIGVSLLYALALPYILRSRNLLRLLFASIFSVSALTLLFGLSKTPLMAIAFFVLAQLAFYSITVTFSLLFHENAESEEDYKRESSLQGSISCFVWTVGPLLATLLIDTYSFFTLFLIGSVATLSSVVPLFVQKIPVHKKRHPKHVPSIFRSLKEMISSSRLRSVYLLASSIDMWWVYIMVFMALFMKDLGYSDESIGLFIAITQLPLFLLEFAAYKVVLKYNYRMPYRVAYVLIIATLCMSLILGIGSLASLVVLLLASLSLAFIEPTAEMLIFDTIKKSEQENLVPIYGTSGYFGDLVTRFAIGATLVYFSPTVTLFVMIAMFSFLLTQTRHLKS